MSELILDAGVQQRDSEGSQIGEFTEPTRIIFPPGTLTLGVPKQNQDGTWVIPLQYKSMDPIDRDDFNALIHPSKIETTARARDVTTTWDGGLKKHVREIET